MVVAVTDTGIGIVREHLPHLFEMIIAVTGWGQEEDQHESRAAGFGAHLVKPVDGATLLATLAGVEDRGP